MTDLLPFDAEPVSEPGRARHTDPPTSHQAAASVDAGGLQSLVLAELRAGGPATTVELALRLGLSLVSVSPRLKPLESKGFVVRTSTRHNPSGRSAVLWAAR